MFNMKFILLLALAAIAFVSVEAASKQNKKKCNTICTFEYDPVCAKDIAVMGGRPRTFANECVMNVHNCEHGAYMEVMHKGECPNSGGIRIS